MLSSSEGYGSLIQHATSFLPAGWATGPNVFYHHGALGLCSPNLSTRAANMTNWCGASIVFHTSTLTDCVSAEVPVLVQKTKPFYCTGGFWSEVFVVKPLSSSACLNLTTVILIGATRPLWQKYLLLLLLFHRKVVLHFAERHPSEHELFIYFGFNTFLFKKQNIFWSFEKLWINMF